MPSKGKSRSARKRPAASDNGTKSEKAHGDGANADIHLPIQILPSKSTTTLDSFEVPRRIAFKESQKFDDDVSCLLYLRDGRLLSRVYGGINGFITNFTLRLEDIGFFCEYDNHLFVLSHGRKFRVHVVNVTNYTIQNSVIICRVDGFGQIAVNEHYIGISDTGQKCVKIFSATDYSHLYDIKDDIGRPYYLAFLNDNLVVGDWDQNLVTCATLTSTPEVQWKNTDIAGPCSIRVCSQLLLIGTGSRQIYALSREGQILSVFDVPECADGITDIAVFGKQLAVGNGSKAINVYEIEDDK